MPNISFIDLSTQQKRIKDRIDASIQKVLSHGAYILGPEVGLLEQRLAEFSGVEHAITCANGTDALLLALMALQVKSGDVIFCPSFTFAATAEVVPCLGATPYFVDVSEDDFNIDPFSLEKSIFAAEEAGLRPRGVIAVDLFGLPADYDRLEQICKKEGLFIIADSAQGYGAGYKGRITGAMGDLTTTSFFPAKPLGCYGDGGAVLTDNTSLAELITSYRFHGKGDDKYDNKHIGMNSRLDTLQAAILLEKLEIYREELNARDKVATRYLNEIRSDKIGLPSVPPDCRSVWAQFTLKAQDALARESHMQKLNAVGIPTAIYYPKPLHLQTAYNTFPTAPAGLKVSERLANSVFSIPMHPYLDETAQEHIIETINSL